MKNQIERIQYFETVLDEAKVAVGELTAALENYDKVKDKIEELVSYYESPLWMKDYRDDEEGKLPKDLKRVVLSEDAVYNLLSDYVVLQEQLKENSIN